LADGLAANDSQQSVVAHRQHQSASEARGRPAAKRKPEMMDKAIEPRGSAGPGCQNIGAKSLGENCAATKSGIASKTPRDDDEPNLPASQRQISQTPKIAVVDVFGDRRTVRASTCFNHVANGDDGHRAIMNGALDVKTGRHESRGAKASKHGVDSFVKPMPARAQTSSKMSQSPDSLPIDKLNSTDVIDVLSDLFIMRGVPGHVRSNNGPEFVAKAVQDWIGAVGAKTAYIESGSPWENDYCESFNSKLRDELLDGEIFYTLEEARVIIENCRRCYNEIRPHLQAVTPRVLLLACPAAQPERTSPAAPSLAQRPTLN
jgi:transposase InsO family protein